MPEEMVALFPLGVVLFPGAPLPLHIFEERYKVMLGDVLRDTSEFGVVLASGEGIVDAGCSALVEQVLKQYPDGRMDILAVGRRRFRLFEIDEQRPFLRGKVDFFEDDDADPPEEPLVEKAIRGYYSFRNLRQDQNLPEPRLSDPLLSFQLAQPIADLNFRQTLLLLRSEAQRIRQLAEYFPTLLDQERRIGKFREVIPTNGHGKYPSN
jgi:Lon protease-like protein